jgi:hypothetical protein
LAGLLLLLLLASHAAAQSAAPAGQVASLEGHADVQRGGQAVWTALATGKDVFVGDHVRTGDASRLKLLMRDDSVLTLGAKAELTIDAQVVHGGPEGTDTTRLGQLVGSLRAVVTERYGTKGSSFEVRTPTAIAGVRGTGFVTLVDEDGKRTRVIGIYDTTYVRSVIDPSGRHEVHVGPHEMTEILAGELPSKTHAVSGPAFDALVAPTEVQPGPPEGTPPSGPGAQGPGAPPAEGSGDPGDPATPVVPSGRATGGPSGPVDQPIDHFRQPPQPPPPPPNR